MKTSVLGARIKPDVIPDPMSMLKVNYEVARKLMTMDRKGNGISTKQLAKLVPQMYVGDSDKEC